MDSKSSKPLKCRLDKLLANLGYGSRKDVTKLIKAGLITAGDTVLNDPSAVIEPSSMAIVVDGEPLDPVAPFTILVHKPAGYTCSHDEHGAILFDILPDRFRGRSPSLSSAGRLDKESTGAVLMTDDGDLLHRIISPKLHVTKHYDVTLAEPLRGDETALFMSGSFTLKDDTKPLKPALWQPISATTGIMHLNEGRYHQIRRMFGALGNKVTKLHRASIGGLTLGDLPEGAFKQLSRDEIDLIFKGGH